MIPPISAVIVLYRPPPDIGAHLEFLRDAGLTVHAVYNECDGQVLAGLESIAGIRVIAFPDNRGLAAALNAGIDLAKASGATRVLLLDQDSRPTASMAQDLCAVFDRAIQAGLKPAAVGPLHVDIKGKGAPSHRPPNYEEWREVQTIITSGTILSMDAIQNVGLMWPQLFIDQIDHEWCFRAHALGWSILEVPSIEMKHDLGDSGIQVFGKFKGVHRSPIRHYHIIRNTLALLRISGIPSRWRTFEAFKTLYRIPAYIAFSSDKLATLRYVYLAVRDQGKVYASRPKEWR